MLTLHNFVGGRVVPARDGPTSLVTDPSTGEACLGPRGPGGGRGGCGGLKRVHLELGGKAPAIVFDDADPELAAQVIADAGGWPGGGSSTS